MCMGVEMDIMCMHVHEGFALYIRYVCVFFFSAQLYILYFFSPTTPLEVRQVTVPESLGAGLETGYYTQSLSSVCVSLAHPD